MDIGMLWFDDDAKRSLGDKVARAVDYYKTKYGTVPTICFVNPATLKTKDAPDTAGGVQLRSARNVLVDHFWIGVAESNGNGNGHGNGRARGSGARPASSGRPSRARVPA